MNYAVAHLRSAAALLAIYNGTVPLAVALKHFFAGQKKYGSKDRKFISKLCYEYFRLGKLCMGAPLEKRIVMGHWLCNDIPNEVLVQELPPLPIVSAGIGIASKLEKLATQAHNALLEHTPWTSLLGSSIQVEDYVQSFTRQPGFFLRIRPGYAEKVRQNLAAQGIRWNEITDSCIELPQGTAVDKLVRLNKEVVVQDASSQHCGKIIQEVIPRMSGVVWDACAASGGKTILLHDIYGTAIQLRVSDVRPSIMQNLRMRLKEAGIFGYQSFIADLSKPGVDKIAQPVDVLITDVPCTGSGTWARTPEQHFFFEPSQLQAFTNRQWAIVQNTIPALKNGGYHIYITCSVFAAENEAITEKTLASFPSLTLMHAAYINGMTTGADTMYIAIFQKNDAVA